MDSAWISGFSAVMGSLVGAFTSFVTTYANQRSQYRRDFLSRQFAQRETLYSEFVNEAARLQVDFAGARTRMGRATLFCFSWFDAGWTVLLYTPRNAQELSICYALLSAAYHSAVSVSQLLLTPPPETSPQPGPLRG